ncbi:hypothetical protein [Thermococcus sp.]
MKTKPLLLILSLALMISAALVPAERYHGPGDSFFPSSPPNFSAPDCKPTKVIYIACTVNSTESLNITVSYFNEFPHESIVLYAGEGGSFNVFLKNGSRALRNLPKNCRIVKEKESLPLNETERKVTEDRLKALRELETAITNKSDREFIHNLTVNLEYALGIREKVMLCNGTLVEVDVAFPPKESNAPLTFILWSGVFTLGLFGVFASWRDGKKTLLAVFLLTLILSFLFIGTYIHNELAKRSALEGMAIIENLNGSESYQRGCDTLYFHVIIRNQKDAMKLRRLIERFNASVGKISGDRYMLTLDGTLERKNLQPFKKEIEEFGWYSTLVNNTDFCSERITELERENRIILEHLDDLSSESRETLLKLVDENRRYVELWNKSASEYVRLHIAVGTPPTPSPEEYHELSKRLATLGAVVILAYIIGSRGKESQR